MDGIENLCGHLPGAPAKLCKDEVEKMFPVVVTFLTTVMVSVWDDVGWRGQSNKRGHLNSHIFPVLSSRNHPRYAGPLGSAKAVRGYRWCSGISQMRPYRQPRATRMSVNHRRGEHGGQKVPAGAFTWFLFWCLTRRCSRNNAASAFCSWRLWRACCLKRGRRWITLPRQAPTGGDAGDSRLCVSSPGRCHRPAGGDLQYSALVLPQPVPGAGGQVQQEGAGRHPELRHPAGHLRPPPDVQRPRGTPVRLGE